MSSAPPPPPGGNPWSTPGQSGQPPSAPGGYGTPQPGYGTPQPGYGATPPGYGGPPPPPGSTPWQAAPQYARANPWEKRSTTVLVLGILSLVICGLLGPIGWSMGSTVRKEALAAGWPEPGNNKAGRICSIISSCLLILVVGFIVLGLIAAAASNSSR